MYELVYVADDYEKTQCTVEDILAFFTGSRNIPPLGFPLSGTIDFNDRASHATASTCTLTLTLPSKYGNDEERMCEALTKSFKSIDYFGQV